MYLISAAVSILCLVHGPLVGARDTDLDVDDQLDEHFVDMKPENMKLSKPNDNLYFDENTLEEELSSSEEDKSNAVLKLIICIASSVVLTIVLCIIVIIICRKYGSCCARKE